MKNTPSGGLGVPPQLPPYLTLSPIGAFEAIMTRYVYINNDPMYVDAVESFNADHFIVTAFSLIDGDERIYDTSRQTVVITKPVRQCLSADSDI